MKRKLARWLLENVYLVDVYCAFPLFGSDVKLEFDVTTPQWARDWADQVCFPKQGGADA